MRRPKLLALSLSAAVLLAGSLAYADDATAAHDELAAGYALKQVGNCRDAIPHFARSYQLDATPKALLNEADCEAQLGELVSAYEDATHGRDLAHQKSDAELAGVADEQIAALDKRVPRLTIRLAADAPAGTTVTRDGAALDATSLGKPIRFNPGAHVIAVTAPGRGEARFDMTLAEGDSKTIDVAPGAAADTEHAGGLASLGTRRIVALTVGGVGVIGMAIGIGAGLAAGSTHGTLEHECPGNACPPSAQSDLDSFRSMRTVSTVGYVFGFAGLAAGAVLWLTTPSSSTSGTTAHGWIGPASAGLAGTF